LITEPDAAAPPLDPAGAALVLAPPAGALDDEPELQPAVTASAAAAMPAASTVLECRAMGPVPSIECQANLHQMWPHGHAMPNEAGQAKGSRSSWVDGHNHF
jgi:hypothetical protein